MINQWTDDSPDREEPGLIQRLAVAALLTIIGAAVVVLTCYILVTGAAA